VTDRKHRRRRKATVTIPVELIAAPEQTQKPAPGRATLLLCDSGDGACDVSLAAAAA